MGSTKMPGTVYQCGYDVRRDKRHFHCSYFTFGKANSGVEIAIPQRTSMYPGF